MVELKTTKGTDQSVKNNPRIPVAGTFYHHIRCLSYRGFTILEGMVPAITQVSME
jgi:hypothetical protein